MCWFEARAGRPSFLLFGLTVDCYTHTTNLGSFIGRFSSSWIHWRVTISMNLPWYRHAINVYVRAFSIPFARNWTEETHFLVILLNILPLSVVANRWLFRWTIFDQCLSFFYCAHNILIFPPFGTYHIICHVTSENLTEEYPTTPRHFALAQTHELWLHG